MAIEFSQIQKQIADKLQSQVADKATQGEVGSGQPQPTGDGAARFQAYMEGFGGSGSVQPTENSAPSQVGYAQRPTETAAFMPNAGVEGSSPSMSLGDRILANMSSFQPQAVPAQEINPVGSANAVGPTIVVDAQQAIDWQLQTAHLKEEVGLSATTSQSTEQDVEALLKAQQ